MQTYLNNPIASVLVAISVALVAGCGSNLPAVSSAAASAPAAVTYDAATDRVWAATQGILAEVATFKVLDKSSSIMVTEFKTIESQELSLIGTAFLGKTYKNNYTITFVPVAQGKTTVRISVGLQSQQVGFFTREADDPQVTGHLRQKMFDKIATALK